ncbi:MAG: MptD family putative ECF transporter S component, partial [Bacteroidales bacterium]|nr:MptD family putative ECF transporter S component [Bacteroidales bacterium]
FVKIAKNQRFQKILLLGIAYLAVYILGSASGLIHPMCYAYIGAILPFLFAFIYLHTTMEIRNFGAATVLNGFMLVVGLITGEAGFSFILGIIITTAFSEIIRLIYGYNTLKGVRVSFIPFAFSFFAKN